MYRRSRQWESYLWEPQSSSKIYLIPKVLSHNRLSCCLPLWKGFGIVPHTPRVYARRAATVGTELPSRICGGIAQPNIGMAIPTRCTCVLCARRDFTAIDMTENAVSRRSVGCSRADARTFLFKRQLQLRHLHRSQRNFSDIRTILRPTSEFQDYRSFLS